MLEISPAAKDLFKQLKSYMQPVTCSVKDCFGTQVRLRLGAPRSPASAPLADALARAAGRGKHLCYPAHCQAPVGRSGSGQPF